MNLEALYQKTQLVLTFYLDSIEHLEMEIESGHYSPRDFNIGGIFQYQLRSKEYFNLARANSIDFAAFDTSLDRMEQQLHEFTTRRDALLAQLGPEETQRRLLEEITILVNAYCEKVKVIRETWTEMAVEEYEEFAQDDELSDLETLTLRSSVNVLLPLLAEGEAKAALEQDLAQADATLRRHGAEMFGPLLRIGSIQQLREARFEPKERWWWYLDEIARSEPNA